MPRRHTRDTTWPPPCIFLLQVAQRAHGLQPRCRINRLLRDLSDDGAQTPPLAARPACCVAIPRLLLARALCPMFLEAQRAILTRCPPYELTCACSSAGWEASRLLNGRRSIVAIAPHNYIRSTHIRSRYFRSRFFRSVSTAAHATVARTTSSRSTTARSTTAPLLCSSLASPSLTTPSAASLHGRLAPVHCLARSAASRGLPLHAPFKQHDAVGAPLAL